MADRPVLPGTPATAGGRLAGSALVGGVIGVVMEAIVMGVSSVLPAEAAQMAAPLSLIVLGIVGAVMSAAGLYAPINAKGGFGAAIMFCGLADATCGIFTQAKMASGKTGAGVTEAVKFAVAILGVIATVGIVLGFVLGTMHVPGAMMTLEAVPAAAAPMNFVGAFVSAAVISVVGQALLEFTPAPLPAVILIEAAVAMIMVVVGLYLPVTAMGCGGVTATVVGAAMTCVASGVLLAIAGVPVQAVITVAVMACVVVFGIVAGLVASGKAAAAKASAGAEVEA